jgi:hypothetical protein
MKKAIFAVLLLLAWAARAGAQSRWGIDTTCLELYFNQKSLPLYNDSLFNVEYNPDSVMIDTCLVPLNEQVWIHRGIRMVLPILEPWAPADSIVEVPWTALDTDSFYHVYRTEFQHIYDSVGPYVLRKLDASDTTGTGYQYEFRFFGYTPADTIYRYLDEIPGIFYYGATPEVPDNGGGNVVLQTEEKNFENLEVYPVPSLGIVHVIVPVSENNINFTVLDELGRVIEGIPMQQESEDVWTLDFSYKFPPGIYFIQCGSYSARVILESNQ